MSIPRIGQSASYQVETTRPRETPRLGVGFREMITQSGKVLLAGTEVAGSLVGGPLLSAAVARLRTGADASSASLPSGSTSLGGTAESLRAMQSNGMSEELQLLSLQSEVQRQDRQISLASNLLKARHDAAKQAIGNIRA